jgi:hypothetical protein
MIATMFTAAQAAERYTAATGRKMSARRMRQLAQRGQIDAQRVGARTLVFTAAAVDAFAAQQRPNMPKPTEPQ